MAEELYGITKTGRAYSIVGFSGKPANVSSPAEDGKEPRQYAAENLDAWKLLGAVCDLYRNLPEEFDRYGDPYVLQFTVVNSRDERDRVIQSVISFSNVLKSQRERIMSSQRRINSLEERVRRAKSNLDGL